MNRCCLRSGFLVVVVFMTACKALSNVRITVPMAVVRGDDATLECFYNLEDDQLYAIKWYLGHNEFYRYTPKESPPIKQFPTHHGLKVREGDSNANRVVLEHVPLGISGRYTCEVSADAPSFFTRVESATMQVVELPRKDPYITGLKTRYHHGDILKANCTSEGSLPASNLTWIVNGEPADHNQVHNGRFRYLENGQLLSSMSSLRLKITKQLFSKHRLKIRCVASMYDIYYKSNERSVEWERERRRHNHLTPAVTTTTHSSLWELPEAAESIPETKLVFQTTSGSDVSLTLNPSFSLLVYLIFSNLSAAIR